MDFRSEDDFGGQYRPPVQPHDAMVTASIVLSVIAIATSCCVYASLICGSLSIILALLARGQQKKPTPQGRLAITTAAAAMILSVVVTVFMFVATIQQYGSLENFMKTYSEMMEAMTGMPLFPEGGF